MEFIDPTIEAYAEAHSTPESEVLAALNRETHLKVLYPRMLSGHLQGSVLSLISKLHRPRRIIEVGTYTGYSAICMASGLTEDGMLHTLDIDGELKEMAESYFEKAGVGDKITMHIGNALDVIPTLDETFDLALIDADKSNYVNYFNLIFPKMRSGGIILADNVLWSGRILDESVNDKETQGIREFNKFVKTFSGVEHVLLPIRDGIMVIRKL